MTESQKEPQDELGRVLLLALETPPQVAVPADFTARLMNRLPKRKSAKTRLTHAVLKSSPRYGRMVTMAALAVLLIALLVMTPVARSSSMWMMLQMLLLVQLGAFTLWLGLGAYKSR